MPSTIGIVASAVGSVGVSLPFGTPGDTNGVLYYKGTSGLTVTFSNPITSGAVRYQLLPQTYNADLSQFGINYATDRGAAANAGFTGLDLPDGSKPWVTIDLLDKELQPNYYTIQGRSDFNGNFLRSWIFEGSNDNTNWTTLDTRTGDTQQGQGIWGTYTASASIGYRYLRIRQTAVDSSGNWLLGLGEIEFYGVLSNAVDPSRPNSVTCAWSSNGDTNGLVYFIGTSNLSVSFANPITSRKITTYVLTQYQNYGYYPYLTMERADANPWHSNGSGGDWIVYDLGQYRLKPNNYTIKGRADYNGLFPYTWVFEGSNDMTSWTTLDSRTADTSIGQNTWGKFSASASVYYRYLRIRATGTDSSFTSYLTLGEVEFYGDVQY